VVNPEFRKPIATRFGLGLGTIPTSKKRAFPYGFKEKERQ
jgi:hypothetical protein